jgi:multidrug efflux pump subunit AcrB
MKAIDIGLRNPYLVTVVVLAVFVVGVTAMMRIPADLLPIFKTPAVQIVTFYPGMPPEVMEQDITSRLERWTGQSVGIERQESKSMLGVSVVKDFFREDISFDTAMSQVTSYAMSDLFYLPPGTIPPMVMPFDPTASVPLCLVSVSSPTMSEKELYDLSYFELRNSLQGIQGVIAPAVYGGKLRRILAYVDRHQMEARGLSPMDVVASLKAQNVLVPTGNAKFGDIDYQIISNAMEPEVHSLNDIPIKTDGQAVVFMRDVGEVKDSSQIQSNSVRINGRRQVYVPIYRQPGANTISIVNGIKQALPSILNRLREKDAKAKDMSLEVVMDQSTYVRSSINGLQVAATLGALLAGVVVLVFLRSLRSTFVIILAIPIAILATFIGLFYTGDTINSMTLGGLALAIGILVDQSIVVLDNITRHMQMGKSGYQASLDGTREVAMPVLVSTMTFVVVFFPVVFLTGIPRFLFTPLAVAVIFAVIASYVVAMFVIPSFCAKFLKVRAASSASESDAATAVPPWFGAWFSRMLSMRWLVIAGSGGVLALALLVLSQTGTELFPQVDSSQFTIYVRLPSGTRIERTEETIAEIERVLMDEMGQPDTEYPKVEKFTDSNLRILISNIGVLMDWPAAYTPNTGPMDAFVLVQLKGKSGMPSTFDYVETLRDKLNRQFPGVDFAFDTGGMMTAALNFGLPSPINVRVQGSNLFTAEEIAMHVQRIASSVPGATDVRIAQRMDYPQVDIQVDRVKAAQLGVTQEDVVKNIVTTVNSSINFDPAFWIDEKNGNHYFFGAQYAEEDIDSIETLRNVPITGKASFMPVALRNIAEFGRKTGPAVVSHVNITRTIDVFANVERGYDVGSVASEMEKRLAASPVLDSTRKPTPRGVVYEVGGDYGGKGYRYSMSGEVETMRSSFVQFGQGLGIAVILVYLTMVAQLRSFGVPFVILLTIPLGFIGVGFALWATGTNLNIPAFMGIIMMTGIVVEYSIILLDFANQRIRDGLSIHDAIREAAWIRLRPILMTSLTTLLALLPMAIGFAGGEANAPLARTIVGGVLAATVLTLVVVPCLYILVKRPEEIASPQIVGA